MNLTPRRKRIRIHFSDSQPSIEGFLMHKGNGHYHLAVAEILQTEDQTIELGAREVAIPRERVWFYEVVS